MTDPRQHPLGGLEALTLVVEIIGAAVLCDHVDDAGNHQGDWHVDRNCHIYLGVFGKNGHPGEIRCTDYAVRGIFIDVVESRVRQASPNGLLPRIFANPRAGVEFANPRSGQQNAGRTVRHVGCGLYTEAETRLPPPSGARITAVEEGDSRR
ncbi:hypothetical protein GCM10023319_23650 [Nocardia iowensis]